MEYFKTPKVNVNAARQYLHNDLMSKPSTREFYKNDSEEDILAAMLADKNLMTKMITKADYQKYLTDDDIQSLPEVTVTPSSRKDANGNYFNENATRFYDTAFHPEDTGKIFGTMMAPIETMAQSALADDKTRHAMQQNQGLGESGNSAFIFNPFSFTQNVLDNDYKSAALEGSKIFLPMDNAAGHATALGLGAYGLLNENGLPKTWNYLQNGEYGNAALSGAGDAFNALMTAYGFRGARGDVSNFMNDTGYYQLSKVPALRNWSTGKLVSNAINDEVKFANDYDLNRSFFTTPRGVTNITKLGDLEMNNPNLFYRVGPKAIVDDFVNTGGVRVHNVHPYKVGPFNFTRIVPNPMFAKGTQWLPSASGIGDDFTIFDPSNDGILISTAPMRIGTKSGVPTRSNGIIINPNGTTYVSTNGNRWIPRKNKDLNSSNTTGYIYEPGYGWRLQGREEPSTYVGLERMADDAIKEPNLLQFDKGSSSAPDGTLSVQDAAEQGRQAFLNYVQSPWYKERWLKEFPDEDIDRVLNIIYYRAKKVPFDFSKNAKQLDAEGVTSNNDVNNFTMFDINNNPIPVMNGDTGMKGIEIASDASDAARTAFHELLHYTTNNAKGLDYNSMFVHPSKNFFGNAFYNYYSPIDKTGSIIIPKGKMYQHGIINQNERSLPKRDPIYTMVWNDPDKAKALLVSQGYTPEHADNWIKAMQKDSKYMWDIQEQRAHLQTWFAKEILPNIKNPNDANEIEQYFIDNPDILKKAPSRVRQVMHELRPGSSKDYAKYFAEALSTIPFINMTTNGNKNN